MSTATTDTSATTVYCEKVDVPIWTCQLEQSAIKREGTHKVVDRLSFTGKAARIVGHETFALGGAN